MTSFDVHQHLWPERLINALRQRERAPRLDGDSLVLGEGTFAADLGAHTLEARLALLDAAGVDVALISLQPTLGCDGIPELVDAYHDGILELVEASSGRLRAFAVADCRPGFAGACVSAPALVAGIGRLPARLVEAGQVLFVHPGPVPAPPEDAPPWWAAIVDYCTQMQAASAFWSTHGHPDLPVVFGILAGGAPFQLERLRARGGDLAAVDAYFDAASYGRLALELTAEACGRDRILFGSDAPVMDPELTLTGVADAGLTEVALRENPSRLFA
ncbi:MAG: amidohydrolase family protein [Gaiellaceae bacterium]